MSRFVPLLLVASIFVAVINVSHAVPVDTDNSVPVLTSGLFRVFGGAVPSSGSDISQVEIVKVLPAGGVVSDLFAVVGDVAAPVVGAVEGLGAPGAIGILGEVVPGSAVVVSEVAAPVGEVIPGAIV